MTENYCAGKPEMHAISKEKQCESERERERERERESECEYEWMNEWMNEGAEIDGVLFRCPPSLMLDQRALYFYFFFAFLFHFWGKYIYYMITEQKPHGLCFIIYTGDLLPLWSFFHLCSGWEVLDFGLHESWGTGTLALSAPFHAKLIVSGREEQDCLSRTSSSAS